MNWDGWANFATPTPNLVSVGWGGVGIDLIDQWKNNFLSHSSYDMGYFTNVASNIGILSQDIISPLLTQKLEILYVNS